MQTITITYYEFNSIQDLYSGLAYKLAWCENATLRFWTLKVTENLFLFADEEFDHFTAYFVIGSCEYDDIMIWVREWVGRTKARFGTTLIQSNEKEPLRHYDTFLGHKIDCGGYIQTWEVE